MRSLSTMLLGVGTLLGAAALTAQPSAAQPPVASAGAQVGTQRGARGAGHAALRGITLSDAQRAQLRTVMARYRTQHQALREQVRAQRVAGQATRPDSAARTALRARVRDLRRRQLADVRAVLTPDQQATFDRNVGELRTRAAAHPRGAGRDAGRDAMGGRRGERGTR